MDPYSADGELVNIHTALHQAQYEKVIDFDTSDFSASNALPVRILKIRAQCATSQFDAALKSITDAEAKSTPDLAAARVFTRFCQAKSKSAKTDAIIQSAEELAQKNADNVNVQILVGSLLASADKLDEALQLLKQHQGSLDAAALIVQIHLAQHRGDLAAKEARAARGFAGDTLLVNLCEAWTWMSEGGEKYQQAYYAFEEIAQGPSTKSTIYLNSQAAAELHMNRLEEARASIKGALDMDANNADALANQIALRAVAGEGHAAVVPDIQNLQSVDAKHPLLEDLTRKRESFAAAAAKYAPKFEV